MLDEEGGERDARGLVVVSGADRRSAKYPTILATFHEFHQLNCARLLSIENTTVRKQTLKNAKHSYSQIMEETYTSPPFFAETTVRRSTCNVCTFVVTDAFAMQPRGQGVSKSLSKPSELHLESNSLVKTLEKHPKFIAPKSTKSYFHCGKWE